MRMPRTSQCSTVHGASVLRPGRRAKLLDLKRKLQVRNFMVEGVARGSNRYIRVFALRIRNGRQPHLPRCTGYGASKFGSAALRQIQAPNHAFNRRVAMPRWRSMRSRLSRRCGSGCRTATQTAPGGLSTAQRILPLTPTG
jgi:hypothetical protein